MEGACPDPRTPNDNLAYLDRHKVGFIATTQPIDTSTLPGVENNVITGRKFIRVVRSALKYSAVNDAGGALESAPEDGHPVAPFEAVVVAHTGRVARGHTARQWAAVMKLDPIQTGS